MTISTDVIREAASEQLNEGRLLHLASQANGVLWMCHVWYAIDGNDIKELVFTSNKNRRHSNEIQNNSIVSGGIVPKVPSGLGEKVQGLSFEGNAKITMGDEMRRAYDLYASRWQNTKNMFSADDIANEVTDMRMYIVSISRLSVFDEIRFPDSPKQEILF